MRQGRAAVGWAAPRGACGEEQEGALLLWRPLRRLRAVVGSQGWLRAGFPGKRSGPGGVGAGGHCRLAGVWFPPGEARDGGHQGMLPGGEVAAALPPYQDRQFSCVRGSGVRGVHLYVFISKAKKSVKFKPFAISPA